MLIHGYEKLSLVDYDGLTAATVFTGGCNFRCPYCHNAVLVNDSAHQPRIPEAEVLSYLEKRAGLLDGVCVTGGEPTLDPDLPAFLKNVKSLGYRVKLDTNGTRPDLIAQLRDAELLDYVAVDVKNSLQKYAESVGKPGFNPEPVERTVRYLLTGAVPYEFRTTLTSELHSERSMASVARWIAGADRYFLQKFIDRGSCLTAGQTEVPKDRAEHFLAIVAPFVRHAELRGY